MARATAALTAIGPHVAADLAMALRRHPHLVAEAANGRTGPTRHATGDEARLRTEQQRHAERRMVDVPAAAPAASVAVRDKAPVVLAGERPVKPEVGLASSPPAADQLIDKAATAERAHAAEKAAAFARLGGMPK